MNKNHEGDACLELELLLEDYLAGSVAGPELERVQAHLMSCSGCAGALENARAGARLLRASQEQSPEPGPFFATRVMAAIGEEESRRSPVAAFWRPLEMLAWRLSLTAAVALAFLIGYGVRSNALPPAPEAVQVSTSGQAESVGLFPEPVQQPNSGDDVLLAIVEKNHGN